MVRILSRSLAMLVATVMVAVSAWALSVSYQQSVFGRWDGPIIDCFCIVPSFDDSDRWTTLYAGPFGVRAPSGAALNRTTPASGQIHDRRYRLTYRLIERDDGGAVAKSGTNVSEFSVVVGGKPAIIRSAEFRGRPQPFFLQLVVPRAVQSKNGGWLTLEIHGFLQSSEQVWLVNRILRTVDFTPPFDIAVAPDRPHVVLPAIAVEETTERNSP